MKLSKKEEKRLRYRRNMPPRSRFELDFDGATLFAIDHPWLHTLVCGLQWLVFFLPITGYVLLTRWKEPLNGAWAVLSVLGTLFLGMGLASLVGALRRGCWGIVPTVLHLGSGLTLLRTALVMQYDPVAAGLISQNMVAHYFVTYLFFLLMLPFYGTFRDHIHKELRQTLREGQIRKWTKGMRNYWWYEEIRRQNGDAPQFGLNKAFTLVIVAATAFHALMGWNAYGATMTNEMLRILCGLLICMEIVRCVQTQRRLFGRPVLLKKDADGKWHSVLSSLLIIAVLVLLACGHTELLRDGLSQTT